MSDVSVVLCTYNGERYVEEQLRTILDQTLPPAEVVVGDDGSTDGTLDVVRAVAATSDVPVHVHRNSGRLGFADNFLRACDRATGRYIAFSDQDDRRVDARSRSRPASSSRSRRIRGATSTGSRWCSSARCWA